MCGCENGVGTLEADIAVSPHLMSRVEGIIGRRCLVKKAEVDSGKQAGVPTDMAEKLKALERENRELRQANEILRKASAYFAQAELDRRVKP